MARVGTIDIGTNSVLLLVTEQVGGVLLPHREISTVTRLGQGVDKSRRLAAPAVERTLECLREYRRILTELYVEQLAVVGTSALRDALGAEEFLMRAQEVLAVPVEVISGEREARLAFSGALSGLSVSGRVLVIDIGGGSTEFIVGECNSGLHTVQSLVSLNIGSVRLTERHLASDPPTKAELEALRRDVDRELAAVGLPGKVGTVVGVAGTVTTLASVIRKHSRFDANALHGTELTLDELNLCLAELSRIPVNAREALVGMNPGRADVIVAGACILQMALSYAGAQNLQVSARGVRWGLAQELTSSG